MPRGGWLSTSKFSLPTSRSVNANRALRTLATMPIDYDTILKAKYPAKQHAQRVVDYVRSKIPNADGVLYLEGRMTKLLEDNDEPEHFR